MVQDHWPVGSEPQFVTTLCYSWTQSHGGDSAVGRGWRRCPNRYPTLCCARPNSSCVCLECPTLVSGSGVLALRCRTSRSPCRVESIHVLQHWLHNDAGGRFYILSYSALVQCKSNSTGRSIPQRAELVRSMAIIMTSTPVRYPTPNASTGSPQHTSVGVTDPLLCPPELELCVPRVSHPC